MDFPKSLRAIIFDFDGTLFHLDVDWKNLNQILDIQFGPDTLTDMSGLTPEQYDQALDSILKAELAGVDNGEPAQGALETLNIVAREYELAVTSRNTREAVMAGLNKIGLSKPPVVVAKQDVTKLKPHPESLELTLTKLSVKAEQAVLVGDTYHDINAAHAAGIPCIIVKNKNLAYEPPEADYYVDSLADLPGLLESLKEERETDG